MYHTGDNTLVEGEPLSPAVRMCATSLCTLVQTPTYRSYQAHGAAPGRPTASFDEVFGTKRSVRGVECA